MFCESRSFLSAVLLAMLNFEQRRSIGVRAVAALVARPIRERSAHAGTYRTQTSHRCLKLLLSKGALSFNGSPSICITVEIKLKGQQFYGRLLFCKCEWVGLNVCACVCVRVGLQHFPPSHLPRRPCVPVLPLSPRLPVSSNSSHHATLIHLCVAVASVCPPCIHSFSQFIRHQLVSSSHHLHVSMKL